MTLKNCNSPTIFLLLFQKRVFLKLLIQKNFPPTPQKISPIFSKIFLCNCYEEKRKEKNHWGKSIMLQILLKEISVKIILWISSHLFSDVLVLRVNKILNCDLNWICLGIYWSIGNNCLIIFWLNCFKHTTKTLTTILNSMN